MLGKVKVTSLQTGSDVSDGHLSVPVKVLNLGGPNVEIEGRWYPTPLFEGSA